MVIPLKIEDDNSNNFHNEMEMEITIGKVKWKIAINSIMRWFQCGYNSTTLNKQLENSVAPRTWTQDVRT